MSDTAFAQLFAAYPRSRVLAWARHLGVSVSEDIFAPLVKRELVSRGVQPLTGRERRRLKRIALARGDEPDAIGRVLDRPRRGDFDDVYRGALTLAEEEAQAWAGA